MIANNTYASHQDRTLQTDLLSSVGLWFNRILLVAVSALFITIAMRYLVHPEASAAEVNIVLGSTTAVTVARVGFAGFPLGLAILLLGTLFVRRDILMGIYITLVIVTIVTAVRLFGIAMDGATAYNLQLLRPEFAIIILSIIGLVLEHRRIRHSKIIS
jgi:hypothetical protein